MTAFTEPAASDSTYALLARGAGVDPSAPALSFFVRVEDHAAPVRWTHGEWLAQVTRTAHLLRRLGIGRHDVVAFVLPNLPQTHLAIWGGEAAGIVFAVNPLLEGRQIGELLRAANARWLIAAAPDPDPEIWRRVEAALDVHDGLAGVLAVDALQHLPGRVPPVLPATLAGVPVFDFAAEVARERGDALAFAAPEADDIASYFCTGGTTGLPKIAPHSHRNEVANALQLGALAGRAFLRPGATVLTGLPLFHVNAQLGTGLSVLAHGGHILLATPGGFRTSGLIPRFWEIVEHHRVTAFSGVPTVYAGLLQAPRGGRDLSSLTHAICGAAPMPVELFRAVEREAGIHLLEGYGLTESTCVSSINPIDGNCRIGSIGRSVPGQPMQVMVVDGDGRFVRRAATDEVGAICLAGPNVFAGYLNPAHDAGAFFDAPDADGTARRWFNTGDLGREDADGFFWLTGRKKELIIRGGHNIDPKWIEDALAGHPAVALCAAVGRPDARAGEIPVVYVQLRAGSAASEAELLAWAETRVPERAAVPKAVIVLPALPLTAVGKIFKPSLSMREVEQVVRAEAARLGATLDALEVVQEPKRGIVAHYRVAAGDADALATALGAFIFKTEQIT